MDELEMAVSVVFRMQGARGIICADGTLISCSTRPGTQCSIGIRTRGMLFGKNVELPEEMRNVEVWEENRDFGVDNIHWFQTVEEVLALIEAHGGAVLVEAPVLDCDLAALEEAGDVWDQMGNRNLNPDFSDEDWDVLFGTFGVSPFGDI